MDSLALSILGHALAGAVLAAVVWAVGLGWQRLLRPGVDVLAYPLGVLAATLAAWLSLVSPLLAPVSLALLAPAALGVRALPFGAFARSLPFAVALGSALAALLHGPTAERASHAYGDLLFYASRIASARESVLPFRDLLVEGESSTYVETAPTFLGAALRLVDPVLFPAASLPAFLVAAFALGAALRRLDAAPAIALVVAPLAATVVAYPTWITESAPVALALPLVFPLLDLARRPLGAGDVALAIVLLGLAMALTKGFAVVTLAVAAAFALTRLRGEVPPRRLAGVAAPVLVVALAAVVWFALTSRWLVEVLSFKFLPATALEGALDQLDRRDTQALAPALLVLGEVVLAAALALARRWVPLAFLLAAVAGGWFVGGHGFDIALALAVAAALVALVERPPAGTERLLALGGGGLLALSAVFRDISGVRAGLVFVLLLGAGVVAATSGARRVLLASGAAALAAVAIGAGGLTDAPPTLTSVHHDVWEAVRERAGEDDLVFTSETGPAVTGEEGWNYYPGVAGRQVYVAGWSSSPLLVDEERRAERLAANERVLSGEVDPDELDLSREYERYFAVTGPATDVPEGWRELERHGPLALYAIP